MLEFEFCSRLHLRKKGTPDSVEIIRRKISLKSVYERTQKWVFNIFFLILICKCTSENGFSKTYL